MKAALTRSILAISITAAPLVAWSDDGGRFYINPGVGLQSFDSDRSLDDATTGLLGLEYRFGRHWAAELRYLRSSPDIEHSSNDIDLDQLFVDGLFYLGTFGKLEPYLALGVGHARFDFDSKDEETQVNAGAGLRMNFSDRWSARLDLRAINGLDSENTDGLASLGISYAFGGSSAPKVQDSDGDGVNDPNDRCPGTPVGVQVDVNGCPLDSDGDGVADYRDQCPDTPAGREVDENGCKYMLTEDVEMTLEIHFAIDSADVPPGFMPEVERAAQFLQRYADSTADIEGHTDSTGKAEYNKGLSQRRADAVKSVLVNQYGVDASRLNAVGYGEEHPIASNDTQEGRLTNRRVMAVFRAQVEK